MWTSNVVDKLLKTHTLAEVNEWMGIKVSFVLFAPSFFFFSIFVRVFYSHNWIMQEIVAFLMGSLFLAGNSMHPYSIEEE